MAKLVPFEVPDEPDYRDSPNVVKIPIGSGATAEELEEVRKYLEDKERGKQESV